ncbi:MAG: PqqD family protein [Bacteroidota bacterium]
MKIKQSIAVSKAGFIFNPTTGDSYTVNQIAAEILDLAKKHNSLEKVKEEILKTYDVNEKTLTEDLNDFSSHLQQLGLTDNE